MDVVCLSTNVDGDGAVWVCLAIASSNSEIFGVILNIVGHDHWLLFIPLPILGVGDIDQVVVSAFRVIDNEADRWSIIVVRGFCDSVVVNGAVFVIFWEWDGVDGELGRCVWTGGGVVWW